MQICCMTELCKAHTNPIISALKDQSLKNLHFTSNNSLFYSFINHFYHLSSQTSDQKKFIVRTFYQLGKRYCCRRINMWPKKKIDTSENQQNKHRKQTIYNSDQNKHRKQTIYNSGSLHVNPLT
jgi:DNA-directed RNA polymerase subunit N (RpoN/RPB10)